MLEIQIYKEVMDYKETLIGPFTFAQSIILVVGVICSVGTYFLTMDALGTEMASYLLMLVASPFGLMIAVKFQRKNLLQLCICFIQSMILSNTQLVYKPYNAYKNLYNELMKHKRLKQREEKVNAKKLQKLSKKKQEKV